jgi:hypothetical protein
MTATDLLALLEGPQLVLVVDELFLQQKVVFDALHLQQAQAAARVRRH